MTVDEVIRKARELGARMAEHGFDYADNPYISVHGACAKAWGEGFSGMNLALSISRSSRYDHSQSVGS